LIFRGTSVGVRTLAGEHITRIQGGHHRPDFLSNTQAPPPLPRCQDSVSWRRSRLFPSQEFPPANAVVEKRFVRTDRAKQHHLMRRNKMSLKEMEIGEREREKKRKAHSPTAKRKQRPTPESSTRRAQQLRSVGTAGLVEDENSGAAKNNRK
jgi:hypothetical protein